jgi:nitroreductase
VDFRKLVDERWSCRAYLHDEVADEIMREMFDRAADRVLVQHQPWQVHVTKGAATRRFAESLTEHAKTHDETTDLGMPSGYHGVYRDRRRAAGYALYASLGIAKEDWDARVAQRLRNFEFFGAPHVAIVTTDRAQGTYGAIDCGGYVANLLLAAQSLGVATIPQAAIAMHSDHVRAFLGIPDDRLVVCGVSFGYADPAHPVNAFRTTRAKLDETIMVVEG